MEMTTENYDDELYDGSLFGDDDYSPCILEGHDVSYCQDHNACLAQWAEHDDGNHADCHPAACDEADW